MEVNTGRKSANRGGEEEDCDAQENNQKPGIGFMCRRRICDEHGQEEGFPCIYPDFIEKGMAAHKKRLAWAERFFKGDRPVNNPFRIVEDRKRRTRKA